MELIEAAEPDRVKWWSKIFQTLVYGADVPIGIVLMAYCLHTVTLPTIGTYVRQQMSPNRFEHH